MVIVFSCRNDNIIANLDRIIVRNVIVTLVSTIKLYATENVLLAPPPCFPINGWIEHFSSIIKLYKLTDDFCKHCKIIRQPFFIEAAIDDPLRRLFVVNGYNVVLCLIRGFDNIIWVSHSMPEETICLKILQKGINSLFNLNFVGNMATSSDVCYMFKSLRSTVNNEAFRVVPSNMVPRYIIRDFSRYNFSDPMVVNLNASDFIRLVISVKDIQIIHSKPITDKVGQIVTLKIKVCTQ